MKKTLKKTLKQWFKRWGRLNNNSLKGWGWGEGGNHVNYELKINITSMRWYQNITDILMRGFARTYIFDDEIEKVSSVFNDSEHAITELPESLQTYLGLVQEYFRHWLKTFEAGLVDLATVRPGKDENDDQIAAVKVCLRWCIALATFDGAAEDAADKFVRQMRYAVPPKLENYT